MTDPTFFNQTVASELKKLKPDVRPQWGSMTVIEMLDHVAAGFRLSIENVEDEITTPEERLPAYREFVRSEKPFKKELPAPEAYQRFTVPTKGDLEQAKLNFLKAMVAMLAYFEKHPGHEAVHTNFGRLNTEDWLLLHRKHIKHHFTQFGLDP